MHLGSVKCQIKISIPQTEVRVLASVFMELQQQETRNPWLLLERLVRGMALQTFNLSTPEASEAGRSL